MFINRKISGEYYYIIWVFPRCFIAFSLFYFDSTTCVCLCWNFLTQTTTLYFFFCLSMSEMKCSSERNLIYFTSFESSSFFCYFRLLRYVFVFLFLFPSLSLFLCWFRYANLLIYHLISSITNNQQQLLLI